MNAAKNVFFKEWLRSQFVMTNLTTPKRVVFTYVMTDTYILSAIIVPQYLTEVWNRTGKEVWMQRSCHLKGIKVSAINRLGLHFTINGIKMVPLC